MSVAKYAVLGMTGWSLRLAMAPWNYLTPRGITGKFFRGGKLNFPDFSGHDCSFFPVESPQLLSALPPLHFYFPPSLFHFLQLFLIFLLPFSIFLYVFHFYVFLLFLALFFPISHQKFPGGKSQERGHFSSCPPPLACYATADAAVKQICRSFKYYTQKGSVWGVLLMNIYHFFPYK